MNISTLQERTMRELIQRLYAPTNEADHKRIEAALLQANPRLSDMANLPVGTPLRVPPIEGASRAEGESSTKPQANLADHAQRELEAYRGELKDAIEGEIKLVEGQLELIASEQMRGLAGEDRDLGAQMNTLRENLKQRFEILTGKWKYLDINH